MGVYDNAVQTAYRVVQKWGRSVTVVKGSETATSASEPWMGSDSEYTAATASSEVATKAVFVDPKSDTNFGWVEEMGITLHAKGSQIAIVAARGLVDLSQHEGIEDGTVTWKIERAHVLKPGDTTVLYAFEVTQ